MKRKNFCSFSGLLKPRLLLSHLSPLKKISPNKKVTNRKTFRLALDRYFLYYLCIVITKTYLKIEKDKRAGRFEVWERSVFSIIVFFLYIINLIVN